MSAITSFLNYTFNDNSAKKCPPTPARRMVISRGNQRGVIERSEPIQANLYRHENLALGNLIGEGTYAHVYESGYSADEVIKIPHFLLADKGKENFIEAMNDYHELSNCPQLEEAGLVLVPTQFRQTSSGRPYITQKYFTQDQLFSVAMHIDMPGVIETLKTVFKLCFEGNLPPIDLTPSNLVMVDGKLGIMDWSIPHDDDTSSMPGAQFAVHLQSKLEEFGIVYIGILDPAKSEPLHTIDYKKEQVPIGKWLGGKNFAHVYEHVEDLTKVVKIPHFTLGASGNEQFLDSMNVYSELSNSHLFQELKLFLTPTQLAQTESGSVYFIQSKFTEDHRFSAAMHMKIPEVVTTLKALFKHCFDESLPPLNLTPANLVFIDGKLGIIDWKNPLYAKAHFSDQVQTMLYTFGAEYIEELDPTPPNSARPIFNAFQGLKPDNNFLASLSLLSNLKKAGIKPDSVAHMDE
jgi:hypothetical protein